MAVTHQVYISYSSWDKPAADAVCKGLEISGISCWIAPRNLAPGSEAQSAKKIAIEECQIFVLILSSRFEESKRLLEEIVTASQNDKQIVPVRIEDFQPGPSLNYFLGSLHWLDATSRSLPETVKILSKNILQTLQLSGAVPQTMQEPVDVETSVSQHSARTSPDGVPGRPHFDVFISYRRETDAQTARLIRAELQQRGFKVFLDVDDLRPGHFDESILAHIQNAPAFIVILSPGSLDRCSDPEDWVRKEITCALASKRMILPIMMPKFQFPSEAELPQELHSIRVHHGVNYSHDFFDAMMEKIVGYIRTPQGI
jgi:hypothetical protein